MDEKGESNTIEPGIPEPTESDEIAVDEIPEKSSPLKMESAIKGDEHPGTHPSGETDSFEGLSDEETQEFDTIKKGEESEFQDSYLDWDDEEILENGSRKRLKRWVVVSGIVTTVILLLSFALWWLFFVKDPPYPLPDALKRFKRQPTTDALEKAPISTFKHQIKKKSFTEERAGLNVPTQTQKGVKDQALNNLSSGKALNLEIHRKLSMIVTLRSDLIQKQKEIRDLQQTYRERINTAEETILMEKRKAKVNSFSEATKVKPIEYGLRTIHRRKTYISNLRIPLAKLHFASEELLYLERLAGIQQKMLPIAKGIDLETLTRKIDRTLRKHQDSLNRLTVRTDAPPSPDLEATWKEVLQNSKKKVEHKKTDPEKNLPQPQTQINSKILEEIQKGNLSRKQELTWLSPGGASVLSKWSGKVLHLNGLSALHSSTAEILARWEGDWLCLNGLKNISPETAKSLSQWSGERLSLNGLNSISEETARWLSCWKGMELEMVGLAKISPEAIQHLVNREHSGKKMYVSNSFRKSIQ